MFLCMKIRGGRGISSTIDNALAVSRPVAVSDCPMFRHILTASPSVCAEEVPLKTILKNGFTPVVELAKDWTNENLVWEYERILLKTLSIKSNVKSIKAFHRRFISKLNRTFSFPVKNN